MIHQPYITLPTGKGVLQDRDTDDRYTAPLVRMLERTSEILILTSTPYPSLRIFPHKFLLTRPPEVVCCWG
jgi:hypothetical protein